jgi:hypothetical protein
MKLYHIEDIDKFFETIDKCSGRVDLVGKDIRLNLKSKLAQYFSLAQVFAGDNEIEELEIECENMEDTERLIEFMMRG